ncbi:hypothetical protein ACLESO_05195 [Pyxidicoccus sp. 3LG]
MEAPPRPRRGHDPLQAERSPEGRLRFTAPFGAHEKIRVRYEAVMDGDTTLVGTATYENATTLDRIIGSWKVEPAR